MRPNLRIEVLHNGRVLESEEGDLLHPWAHVESGDFIVPSAGEDSARYRVLSRLWSRERSNFHLHVLRIDVALAETSAMGFRAETIALRAKCEELAEVGIETLNRATKAESEVASLQAQLEESRRQTNKTMDMLTDEQDRSREKSPAENTPLMIRQLREHLAGGDDPDAYNLACEAEDEVDRILARVVCYDNPGLPLEDPAEVQHNEPAPGRDRLVGRIVSLRRQLEDARRMASQPPVPEWVVNDAAELGVRIGSRFFWLYKGRSLEYPDGKHDNGTPMLWRPVGKREFGECCLPVALDRMPNRYEVGEGWKPMGDPPVDTEDTPSDLTRTQLSDVFILLEAWDRWDGCSKASRAALRLRASLHEPPETAPPDERKAIGALGDHIDDMRCRADVADDPEEGIEGGSTVAEVLREEAEALENLLRLWPWPAPPDVIDAWCRLTAFGWFRTSDESEIVGSYLLCCKPFTYPKGIGSQ
jgi:hypothetical protein